MSAKYKSPSFLLPNEKNTSLNPSLSADRASMYSMDFNGTDEYINVGYSLNGISSITYSAWIKPETQQDYFGGYIIAAGNYSTTDRMLSVGVKTSNRKIFVYGGQGAGGVKESNFTVTYGNWYHIAIVYTNNQDVDIYVNGNAEGSIQFNDTSSIAAGSPTRIGVYSGVLNHYFTGEIDEVAIFNRALNTTEISALYEGTSPNIYPSNLIASNLNPIVYYPLGEQAQMQGYLGNEASSEWQFPNGVLQDYVMDFDGSSYIDAGDIPLEGVYTISFWINPDASPSNLYFLLDKGDGGSNISIRVTQRSNNTIRFQIGSSNFSSTDTLTNNSWNNVVLIANGSSSKIYINNGTAATGTLTTAANTTQSFFIGTDEGKQSAYYFNGQMSNVVIWNTDQSANIANIYNNGSPQTTYTVTPQNWWKLNTDSVYTPSSPNYTTALDFDGTDDADTNLTIDSTYSALTISAWVNFDNLTSYSTVLGQWRNGSFSNSTVLLYLDNTGKIQALFSSGSGYVTAGLNTTLQTNRWYNLIVLWDGSTVKLYIDGSVQSTTGSLSSLNNSDVTLKIGSYNEATGSGTRNYIDGKISNVAIWNTTLSDSQISTLFNFGTPETNISFSPTAWWKLDNTTTGIQDSSGNGNNGTNNGASEIPSGVAVVPSWKIPSALPIPTINTTSALDFDPSGNKIDLNPKFNFDLTSVNTISVWVNLENYSAFNAILTNNGTGGGSTGTYTQLLVLTTGSVNNTLAFYTYKQGFSTPTANSGWRSNDIPREEFENSWHHVMLVRDGQNVSWYYDGQPWGSGTITDTQTENVDVNCIGQGNASSGVLGKISNLAIWNNDQSSNVSNIYNSGQPQSSYTVTPDHLFTLDNLTTGINDVYSSSAGTATSGVTKVDSNVYAGNIPVNGVSTTLPSTALQQSDLQFDSPYSNYSLSFDGTGDYINCGNNVGLSEISSMAFSNWVKYDNPSQANTWRVSMGNCYWNTYGFSTGLARTGIVPSGGVQPFFTLLSSSGTTNKIGGQNSTSNATSLNPLIANTWYHVAGTWDGTTMKLFINGVIHDYKTFSSSWTLDSTTATFFIGSGAIGSSSSFPTLGNVDEVALWLNKTLTDAEILQIYNNGKPNDISSLSPTNWWRLGENAYFDNNSFIVPNSIPGAPNGTGAGTITTMISADAPGTYANGIGTNLDIVDRVGDAPLSVANSQSYNMIPSNISPYVPGYVGNQIANNFSMTFDGTNDYFDTGDAFTSLSSFSISAWFKSNDTVSVAQSIISSRTGSISASQGIDIYISGNQLVGRVYNNGATEITTSFTDTTNWHHVVLAYNGSTLEFYLDGSSLGTSTGVYTNSGVDWVIGKSNSGPYYYEGKIDEVAIFDTALNAGQIFNDLYQPTSTATNKTADLVNNPNLPNPVAWYRMGD